MPLNYTPVGGYGGPAVPGTSQSYFTATGRDQLPASGPNNSFAVNPSNYKQGTQIAQNYGRSSGQVLGEVAPGNQSSGGGPPGGILSVYSSKYKKWIF